MTGRNAKSKSKNTPGGSNSEGYEELPFVTPAVLTNSLLPPDRGPHSRPSGRGCPNVEAQAQGSDWEEGSESAVASEQNRPIPGSIGRMHWAAEQ